MAKAPPRPEPATEGHPDADGTASERLIRLIEGRIREIEAGAYSEDPTAELGKLSRALTPLVAEQRALAKLERRAIVSLSVETIATWLREQTPEARAKVRRLIEQLDAPSRRSVLA